MKYITTILKKFKSKDIPNPVGRWRIEKCNKAMNNKIDLANEDHCGPCGQYAFEKGKNPQIDDLALPERSTR
jgi:hypothetical protein